MKQSDVYSMSCGVYDEFYVHWKMSKNKNNVGEGVLHPLQCVNWCNVLWMWRALCTVSGSTHKRSTDAFPINYQEWGKINIQKSTVSLTLKSRKTSALFSCDDSFLDVFYACASPSYGAFFFYRKALFYGFSFLSMFSINSWTRFVTIVSELWRSNRS